MNTPADLSREEWQRRYAARLMDRGGMGEPQAIECAADAWAEVLEERNTYGPNTFFDGPEDAADEEMSYWENDE